MAAEVVEEIVQFEALADKLVLVGIESKEGEKIAEEMRAILGKIVGKLNKAIEAIEFVKVLKDAEMNWDGMRKMMDYVDSKL
jgi:pyrimidine operon attenuation protein/uracil phosphoribosyltransferase